MENNDKDYLNHIVDLIADGIVAIDINQKIILFNKGAETIFGYSADAVIGQPLDILIPPQFHEIHTQHVQKFAAADVIHKWVEKRTREIYGFRKNGEIFPAEISISKSILNDQLIFTATIRDISSRKEKEEELRRNEALYRQMFNDHQVVMLLLDPATGNIVDANQAACDFYGYPLAELKTMSFMDVDGDSPPFQISKPYYQQRLASGEIRYVEIYSAPLDIYGQRVLYAIIHDVTDRRQAQVKLKESEEKFRLIAETSIDYIFQLDLVGRATYCSPAVENILGFTPEEIVGSYYSDYVTKDDLPFAEDVFAQTIAGESVELIELNLIHKNCKIVSVETNITPIINDGKVTGIQGIVRDVTERKQAEDALKIYTEKLEKLNENLKKSEKELTELNASKDRFFSIISHDLKSPFTVIMSTSQLLLRHCNKLKPDEIEDMLKGLYESTKNAYALLENLLDWSQVQRGKIRFKPTEIDIQKIAASNVKLFAEAADKKNITIQNQIPSFTTITADQNMISTIFRNLIANAIKFTPRQGHIKITAIQNKEFIEISVIDNGVGIEKKDIKKLFHIDGNHSTHGTDGETGTGLGLILCQEFVEKHGGQIWVESEVEHGSTFKFTLPK